MSENQTAQTSSPEQINWDTLDVDLIKEVHRYADRARDVFYALLDSCDQSYLAKIGINPYYDPNQITPYNRSKVAFYPQGRFYKESDGIPEVKILCPYCDPAQSKHKGASSFTFLSIENNDYETHMREYHGIFPNGQEAPQPFIGETVVFEKTGDTYTSACKDDQMCIICPHTLEGFKARACLACSFHIKDSKKPLAEYFNHFYNSHCLHKRESGRTLRYRSVQLKDLPGYPAEPHDNYFTISNPIIHTIAQLYLEQVCSTELLQPFHLVLSENAKKFTEEDAPFYSKTDLEELDELFQNIKKTRAAHPSHYYTKHELPRFIKGEVPGGLHLNDRVYTFTPRMLEIYNADGFEGVVDKYNLDKNPVGTIEEEPEPAEPENPLVAFAKSLKDDSKEFTLDDVLRKRLTFDQKVQAHNRENKQKQTKKKIATRAFYLRSKSRDPKKRAVFTIGDSDDEDSDSDSDSDSDNTMCEEDSEDDSTLVGSSSEDSEEDSDEEEEEEEVAKL